MESKKIGIEWISRLLALMLGKLKLHTVTIILIKYNEILKFIGL